MAAMHAESVYEDLHDFRDRKSSQSTMALDDDRGDNSDFIHRSLARRCDSFCRKRDAGCAESTPTSSWVGLLPFFANHVLLLSVDLEQSNPAISLLGKHASRIVLVELAQQTPPPYGTPPPTYLEATLDEPPDYSSSESLAQARPLTQDAPQPILVAHCTQPHLILNLLWSMTPPKVDFGDDSIFTSHGGGKGKKAKQAEKAANKSKWGGSGEDGNNNGEEGGTAGTNGGDGEGGAGGGDGGGDENGEGAGGGDGGDDWGDWNGGGGKKKKKGKKGKGGIDEEEERRKREEEEANRKAEEEAAIANAGGSLDWADDAIANVDDNHGFTATKTKKGRKGKNENSSSAANATTTSPFENINLLDDVVPKIDMSFGDIGTKEPASSGFGFGTAGWGAGWGASGGAVSKRSTDWGFTGIDSNTDVADSKTSKTTKATSTASSENQTWSFGGNKSNKKKTTTNGFDFGNYDALNEEEEESKSEDPDPTESGVEDNWGGFKSVNKDSKKKKKDGVDDIPKTVQPVVDVLQETADEGVADGSWAGGWGFGKKDKKKVKGGDALPVPPPPPAAPVEIVADDAWAFGKGNKKKSKATDTPGVQPPPPAAPIKVVTDDTWASSETKKEKDRKRGKKFGIEEISPIDEKSPVAAVIPEPEDDVNWNGFAPKKEKKKGKKNAVTEDYPSIDDKPNAVVVVPELEADPSLEGFSNKKDKKKGKKTAPEVIAAKESAIVVVPESQPDPEPAWGATVSKRDKKKGKNGIEDFPKPEESAAVVVAEKFSAPVNDFRNTWDIGGSKKDKKSKTELFSEDEEDQIESIDLAAGGDDGSTLGDNNWMDSGWASTKKKDKKKVGGSKEVRAEEASPPPPPPPPVATKFLDTSKADTSPKSTKDKKGKKGKVADPEPMVIVVDVPEIVSKSETEPMNDDWGGDTWAAPVSSKFKTKKDKGTAAAAAEKEKEEKRLEDERIKEEERRVEIDKKKPGKKGPFSAATASKTKDLLAGSVADTAPGAEEDTWGSWDKKDKKKGASKNMDFDIPPTAPTPPAMGLTPEPEDNREEDLYSFPPAKSKSKKDTKASGLTRTTSASKGLDAKTSKTSTKDTAEKGIDLLSTFNDYSIRTPGNKMDVVKEETPAKAARSFWGGIGGGTATTSKSKSAKEKEEAKAKEEEKAKEDADLNALLDLVDEDDESDEPEDPIIPPPKNASKLKADSKLTRTNSKGSDKAGKVDKKKTESEALVDIVEETSKDVYDSRAKAVGTNDKDGKDDGWGFFGATKKTGVRKGDESTKEITKGSPTNQKASLTRASNEPEAAVADEANETKQPSKPSKMSTTKSSFLTTSKAAGASSIAEKIKAFEKDKGKKSEAKATPPAPPAAPQPLPRDDKSKLSRTPTSSSKKKDLSPTTTRDDPLKSSKDSVPGSFPSEGADDDIIDIIDFSPTNKKSKNKSAKAKTDFNMDAMIVEAPLPPTSPPTPPPEPVSKTAKKDRARVVRDEGASSWGFWGSAPKKDAVKEKRSKDDADVSPTSPKDKSVAPGLNRSKSTKTPKEKEKEEVSRSSGSDKSKAAESRPTARTRGTGLSSLFGSGASPARTKSTRRASSAAVPKSSSRRESIVAGGSGMPSPPLDDMPEMNSKAAKLMGMGSEKLSRNASTKGKQKARGSFKSMALKNGRLRTDHAIAIPDPYAIDDDDMVLVNGLEDPIINAPIPRKVSSKDSPRDKPSRSKSKREVSPQRVYPLPADDMALPDRTRGSKDNPDNATRANGKSRKQSRYAPDDDIVMVEAGPSTDGPEVITGPDDIAFVEKSREPPQLKRSATSAKKSDGLKGLFGVFGKTRRASDTADRPKTRAIYADEEGTPRRKRTVAGGDEDAKRPRRDDRKSYRSTKPDNEIDGGFATDAAPNGGASTEAEDAEARREARRAKRAEKEQAERAARRAELKELEEKKARRQLNDKAATEARKAKIREMREKKAREDEEREGRKRPQEARDEGEEDVLEELDEAPRDLDPQPTERRSKHRSRNAEDSTSRPRSDRRRSHLDGPLPTRTANEEADRRARREDRRSRRTSTEKPSNTRRKSAPVQDYFDPRNASRGTPAGGDPYLTTNGANDHTSSWVNSQIVEPPPPPPIEPTVIEPPPILGDGVGLDDDDDGIRRSKRKSSRRRSKYLDAAVEGVDDTKRRRERREKEPSSEGSAGDRYARRKSDYASPRAVNTDAAGKRASWFKKITNM
ncbi:hypothetical protein MMC17_008149 [Xylographa soralifera]|nr:hypothetical protein [Xylographa soralifera]